ncbi:hypothetical protein [Halegenticoccus soli]|uniref:hypothetical protein n=1 Tax=Halegenticoccus soli TaxID=1985678 RepID=UPI00117B3884|nr:hypothetical protein [Halegenticoccus soli]
MTTSQPPTVTAQQTGLRSAHARRAGIAATAGGALFVLLPFVESIVKDLFPFVPASVVFALPEVASFLLLLGGLYGVFFRYIDGTSTVGLGGAALVGLGLIALSAGSALGVVAGERTMTSPGGLAVSLGYFAVVIGGIPLGIDLRQATGRVPARLAAGLLIVSLPVALGGVWLLETVVGPSVSAELTWLALGLPVGLAFALLGTQLWADRA